MIQKKTRMTNLSPCSYNQIWWGIFSCVKIREESFFIQSFRINTLCQYSSHSSYNLILSTIGNCKYTSHLSSIFCFFYRIKKNCSDICRYHPKITHHIKTNRIFDKFLYNLWKFFTKKLKYSCNFYIRPFKNIFFWKCPHTHIFNMITYAKCKNIFYIISSFHMAKRSHIWDFFCPSSISIHDESNMFEHSVYKKVPREYQYTKEKQWKSIEICFFYKDRYNIYRRIMFPPPRPIDRKSVIRSGVYIFSLFSLWVQQVPNDYSFEMFLSVSMHRISVHYSKKLLQ